MSLEKLYADRFALGELLRPSRVMEIGVGQGYGAAALLAASAVEYLGLDIEPRPEAEAMLKERFPAATIELRVEDSQQLDKLPERLCDLLVIDGDASYAGRLRDLRLARLLAPTWILLEGLAAENEARRAARHFLAMHEYFGSRHYTSIYLPSVRGSLLLQERRI